LSSTVQIVGLEDRILPGGGNRNVLEQGSTPGKFADLRKRIQEAPERSPLLRDNGPPPRSKRFLTADDLTDIATGYEAGATTNHIASRYSISKTRVATVLREQGITIRRQGLTNEQVSEATNFYGAGRSLAWLGDRYDVSHTTVATALRRQGIQLRPRPGWI
jgi:hypothetical protein